MNIVTGCSGIDAIAYAALLLGIEIKGQIEIDSFCNTILELRYPGVKRYKDIFNVRGDEFGTVDIFGAGIPCQPFSHAGKREGTEDDRYLWPEAIRIIRVMQPTWVIIENVDGIGSMEQSDSETVVETETEICQDTEMVLETIRQDLEEAGYTSIPIILPACSVEAPHQRYRYFIVANNDGCGYVDGRIEEQSTERGQQAQPESIKCNTTLGNTECSGFSGEPRGRTEQEPEDGYSGIEIMADTTGELFDREMHSRPGRTGFTNGSEDVADTDNPKTSRQREYGREIYVESESERFDVGSSNVAYPNSEHSQNCDTTSSRGKQGIINGSIKERRYTRPTQSRMGGNADGLPGGIHGPGGQEDSSGILGAFEEIFTALIDQTLWPAGYGSEQYEYEPSRVATGVKSRTNRLKVLGNAIVWQQIFPILLAIKLIEERR